METKSLKAAAAAGLITVAAIAVYVAWPSSPQTTSSVGSANSVSATFPVPNAPTTGAVFDARTGQDGVAGINPLVKQLLTAPNLRAFIDEAVKQPAQGGRFLARTVIEICHTVKLDSNAPSTGVLSMQAASANGVDPSRVLEAQRRLSQRCEGITPADMAQVDRQTQAPEPDDPVLNAVLRLRPLAFGRDVPETQRREAAQAIAASGIPLAFFGAAERLFAARDPVTGQAGPIYFDGKPYAGFSKEAFTLALEAAGTLPDTNVASAQSFASLLACARAERCDGGNADQQIAQMIKQSPHKLDPSEVQAALKVVSAGLQSRNPRLFLPPERNG